MCMYKIIWLDGASGVGKTTVANFLTNELMEHGLTVDNVDSDYYYQEKYLSNPKIDQSKIKSPWADECFLKYFKGQLVLFCEKNDILVVQMALTYDKCRKKLLESLGEKVAIKHIILNASKQTIKDRLKERAAKGVDQRQALERLNWNIAYLNKYYKEDTWNNTEEKSAENVADEIFRMIEKSRLQKYT